MAHYDEGSLGRWKRMDGLKGLYGGQINTSFKELKFVPAVREDKVPIPEGINLILLDGGESIVSFSFPSRFLKRYICKDQMPHYFKSKILGSLIRHHLSISKVDLRCRLACLIKWRQVLNRWTESIEGVLYRPKSSLILARFPLWSGLLVKARPSQYEFLLLILLRCYWFRPKFAFNPSPPQSPSIIKFQSEIEIYLMYVCVLLS